VGEFEVAIGAIEASRFQVPDAVYQKYRRRVLNEFGLRDEPGLKSLLRQLVMNNNFMSAYFHLTATAIEKLRQNLIGQIPDKSLVQVELADWPFKLAMQAATRTMSIPGLEIDDLCLARVAAFIAPIGLLRTWNILERCGDSPLAYMNSRYGYAFNRYWRSLAIRPDLKILEMYNSEAANVMHKLLVEAAPSEEKYNHGGTQIHRIGAALALVQVWHRETLMKRALMMA
jgi:hypothetical protein